MATGKKYDFTIEQNDSEWVAKITRKITSKKTLITKQQDGFTSEEEAQSWAEEALTELSKTLKTSNERHGAQRDNIAETRKQRSTRRAEKTELAKAEQAKADAAAENDADDSNTNAE